MRPAPFKCIFCLSAEGPFDRVEHPIPEALGNDDLVMPRGFVCDPCNQYFGSKVEQRAVNLPPFGIERVAASVPTKRGRKAEFRDPSGVTLRSTGFLDAVEFEATPQYYYGTMARTWPSFLVTPQRDDDFYVVRLLLKMGLELLSLTDELDPFDSSFDAARLFARRGEGKRWEMAYGRYDKPRDIVTGTRYDLLGPIVTHQLYQYEIGQMLSKDVALCFAYRAHIFACNLSSPSIVEYTNGFNACNRTQLRRIEIRR